MEGALLTGNVEQRCAALPNLQKGCTIAGQRRAAFAPRYYNVVGKLQVLNVRRFKDEARVLTTLERFRNHTITDTITYSMYRGS